MLSIYTRHSEGCLKDLRPLDLTQEELNGYRKCSCPRWYKGTLDGRAIPRTSLGVNTWKEAEDELEKLTKEERPTGPAFTVKHALNEWIEEVNLGGLRPGTTRQYDLLSRRLLDFCSRRKISLLTDLNASAINKWRTEWLTEQTNRRKEVGIKPGTNNNRISALVLFFGFCRRMRMLKENPMDYLKNPRVPKDEQMEVTMPLDEEGDDNYRAILDAIPQFFAGTLPSQKTNRKFMKRYGLMSTRPQHLVAMCELMYETGLRVSDTITFDVDKAHADPRDLDWAIYTTRMVKSRKKARVNEVTVTFPVELLERIKSLPRISPGYVFWDGHTKLDTFNTGQVWRHLKDVGEAIGLAGVRPHRFRDSFAVNRLNEDMSMQELSKLLGHASIEVTEEHYAPYVKSRRDALMDRRRAPRKPLPGNVVRFSKRHVA